MNAELRRTVDHIKDILLRETELMDAANKTAQVSGERMALLLAGRTIEMVYYRVEKKAPLYIGFHGGGYLFGGCAMNDFMWQAVSRALGVNIASIGYRKSPKYQWRETLADAYDAAVYLKNHAEEFGFDATQISLIGGSAGAGLATRTALYALQQGNMFFKNQVLMYPFVDLSTDPLSKGPGSLEGPIMYVFNELHCPEEAEAAWPLVSPVFAPVEELKGMPNTIIVLAENDNLRFEGEKYGENLKEAGVPVHMTCMENMPHGFFESGFGILGEEMAFLGEAVVKQINDGTIPKKAQESLEYMKARVI